MPDAMIDAGSGILSRIALTLTSKLYSRFRRVSAARRGIKNVPTSPAAEIKDIIETAFGAEDELTKATAEAIDSTFNSRYFSIIIDAAHANVVPKYTLSALSQYLLPIFSNIEEASTFANQLWRALSEVSKQFKPATYHVPTTQRAIQRAELSIKNSMDQAERFKSSIDHNESDPATSSALETIRASLNERVRRVDVHAPTADTIRVELDEIYVDPPLCQFTKARLDQFRHMRSRNAHGPILPGWQALLNVSADQNLVILGDPGGGKSTLLKKICFEISRKEARSTFLTPVFVQVRQYSAQKSINNRGLVQYVIDEWSNLLPGLSLEEVSFYYTVN